ncbi:MAG: 16S rRNA (cytosine(967)-C(5))-methyltransferase RsmB [Lachnospiraceae bacterium]|nr:16S rRNA (cytosine(967)-C(5))-methyltransferase RsmB [Lachnospiraceae bacterium]
MNSVNIRELALDVLIEVMEHGGFSHVVIRQTLRKYQYLEKQERSFLTRLTEGTIEYALYLDYVIDSFSNTKVKKMKPLIRNLLRMSVYQILFMDAVPDAAACNEAVKIAIKRNFGPLKGFVNGVLRNISRNKENLTMPNASEDLINALSVEYSMPQWLVEKFVVELGTVEASKLLKAFLSHNKRICVRCNTHKASVDEIVKMLEDEGVTVTRSESYSEALYIEDFDYLERIPAFEEGYIQVQDMSSIMVACIASPKENDFIIDMCAAPGGKSLHMADITKNKAKILARDVSESKVAFIEDNIERTGLDCIETEVWDGTVADGRYTDKADIVVADVPCSGLGVISKKPDIKYKATEDGLKELVKLQRSICENALSYVKPGGIFVYSTCTINKDENENNIKWILDNFDYEPIDISGYIPKKISNESTTKGYIQILPDLGNNDGFFIAKLRRKNG